MVDRVNEINVIKKIIDDEDPVGLLAMGCPADEYLQEAEIIASKLKEKTFGRLHAKFVRKVFFEQFNEKISLKACNKIAGGINSYFYHQEIVKDAENEFDCLKGKLSFDADKILLKLHDNFVVSWSHVTMLVNNKVFTLVEDRELSGTFYDFVKKDNIIYVQYNKKHWWFFLFHFGKSYFKQIDKSKYDYNKLKNKQDVDLVFDNEKTLYKKQV